ncbi:hypothetical protein [Bradyrhizobium macuxiense]|nr:hypothetical protein [Bradyrhizobium macuxiense]
MKHLIAITAALAMLIAGSAANANSNGPDHADGRGYGYSSCADFGRDYQRYGDVSEQSYASWLFGFWSGKNAVLSFEGKRTKDLTSISYLQVKQGMRRYCDQHPLAFYADGADDLFDTLADMPKG